MSLTIYDSKAHAAVPFEPIEPGKAGIYLCGATVQGSPHIGHIRSALAFDVLVRWLERSGYEVTMVRNVTDIDDKILAKSAEAGAKWWAWAYRYEQEFAAAYRALGILPPTCEPRATGHVPDMLKLIQEIVDAGHAYAGDPGNVYFDVTSLADYGSLTRQSLEDMQGDGEDGAPDKRNPHDFALWKAPKPGEPEDASWDSPWGRGRPGWHLECSTMSGRYLGEAFDIHGGGIDLRFPHHENEQAQSHAAGRAFAKYWMHNAWVTVKGEKMSKSLGNSLVVSEILREVPAAVLRFALGTVHYRSTVAYSPQTLAEAATNWERISGFVARAVEAVGEVPAEEVAALGPADLPADFVDAMDADLNVSGALAAIHGAIRDANRTMASGFAGEEARKSVLRAQLEVRSMLGVLGLDPLAEPWRSGERALVAGAGAGGGDAAGQALGALVGKLLKARAQARAAKDWAAADAIRDRLSAAGIVVEDGPEGARWSLA